MAALYLDLETRGERSNPRDSALFLKAFEDRLVILDEIRRVPELFQELRGLIDEGHRRDKWTGRFLILGSASIDLPRQSEESLAGRIEYVELNPFDVLEAAPKADAMLKLRLRGGFPDSFQAASDAYNVSYRLNFFHTYLERDVPQFGFRISAEALGRLWTMLAHSQGALLNASKLAAGLAISAPTVSNHIGLLVDLLLVRQLKPYFANVKKRLVESSKDYLRDSGLVHALLGIDNYNDLNGHPVIGASCDGFVIENPLTVAPPQTKASFYRTAAGAEIDLLLELPSKRDHWAVEIKHGLMAAPSKVFHNACEDLKPKRRFVVNSGEERYPIAKSIEAIGLRKMAALLAER